MVWPARPLNSSILGIRTGDRDMFVSATHQSAKRVTINHTSAEKKSVSKKIVGGAKYQCADWL